MKFAGIMKALEHVSGRGKATEALDDIPDGGKPDDLPMKPETEAQGPQETIPSVETGVAPENVDTEMNFAGITEALGHTSGRGKATEALDAIPDGGKPDDLPMKPEIEAQGPPDTLRPVETGEAPDFEFLAGIPMIPLENFPDDFPGQAEHNGEAEDILEFLF